MTAKGENTLYDFSEDDPSCDTSEGSECSVVPDDASDVPANPPDDRNDQLDQELHAYGTQTKKQKVESGHTSDQEPDEDRGSSDCSGGSGGSGGSGSSASVHNYESITANPLEITSGKGEDILPEGSADDASVRDTPKDIECGFVVFDGVFKVPAIPTDGLNDQLHQMRTSPMKTIEEDKYLDVKADEELDDDRGGSDVSVGNSEPSDSSGTSGYRMCNYQDITANWLQGYFVPRMHLVTVDQRMECLPIVKSMKAILGNRTRGTLSPDDMDKFDEKYNELWDIMGDAFDCAM